MAPGVGPPAPQACLAGPGLPQERDAGGPGHHARPTGAHRAACGAARSPAAGVSPATSGTTSCVLAPEGILILRRRLLPRSLQFFKTFCVPDASLGQSPSRKDPQPKGHLRMGFLGWHPRPGGRRGPRSGPAAVGPALETRVGSQRSGAKPAPGGSGRSRMTSEPPSRLRATGTHAAPSR